LARRAVACKAWRWMPGMRVSSDSALFGPGHPGRVDDDVDASMRRLGYVGTIPDITDPATLGCMLALVREAWKAEVQLLAEVIRGGQHRGQVSHRVAIWRPEHSVDFGWREVYIFETSPDRPLCPVLAPAALVAALEAAPAREVAP